MKNENKKGGEWLKVLSEEDLHFVKRFMLASGSLKELAKQYGVSYPTLRIRLDRLIEKIRLANDPVSRDPFRLLIRTLVADGRVSSADAKKIIDKHEEQRSKK
ncbi:MAG: DUF2089 family protein [Planctomycetota bacterium]|jgi:hypothetical protein